MEIPFSEIKENATLLPRYPHIIQQLGAMIRNNLVNSLKLYDDSSVIEISNIGLFH